MARLYLFADEEPMLHRNLTPGTVGRGALAEVPVAVVSRLAVGISSIAGRSFAVM